ncbi:unnamed protein product [Rotaria magnacalcarata]
MFLFRNVHSLVKEIIDNEEYIEQTIKKLSNDTSSKDINYSIFAKAIAAGDLFKNILGPKGMDKILQYKMSDEPDASQLFITNDRATILSKIDDDNQMAKVLDISKLQYDKFGDGRTSVIVLAIELLRQMEILLAKKIHPQTIITGWQKATNEALTVLEGIAKNNSSNLVHFKTDLINISRTTFTSNILQGKKEHFSKLRVYAILKLHDEIDLKHIQIIKHLGHNLSDSYLEEGFLLTNCIGINMPKCIENARILIANIPLNTDKIKETGSSICVDSSTKVTELELSEKEKMKDIVEKILQYNCNVFINRESIYNYFEQLLVEKGITAIQYTDFPSIQRLAQILSGDILSTFNISSDNIHFGKCNLIEEILIGEDKFVKFSGVAKGEICTIVLFGNTQEILDEVEQSIHDVLCVLSKIIKEPRICYGGASEDESLVIESFASALQQLPTIIAQNTGYYSIELITNLCDAHISGKSTFGLDIEKGIIADMVQLGIFESFDLKRQVVIRAREAVETILRNNNII